MIAVWAAARRLQRSCTTALDVSFRYGNGGDIRSDGAASKTSKAVDQGRCGCFWAEISLAAASTEASEIRVRVAETKTGATKAELRLRGLHSIRTTDYFAQNSCFVLPFPLGLPFLSCQIASLSPHPLVSITAWRTLSNYALSPSALDSLLDHYHDTLPSSPATFAPVPAATSPIFNTAICPTFSTFDPASVSLHRHCSWPFPRVIGAKRPHIRHFCLPSASP